jgi:hypothetical protein
MMLHDVQAIHGCGVTRDQVLARRLRLSQFKLQAQVTITLLSNIHLLTSCYTFSIYKTKLGDTFPQSFRPARGQDLPRIHSSPYS